MADFDPDAYLAAKTDFDPDAYLAAKTGQAPAPAQAPAQAPALASAAAGFIQGFPGAAQLGALGKTAVDVLTGNTSLEDALDEYNQEKQSTSKDLNALASQHSLAALAGQLGSGAVLAPALGGLGGAVAQGAGYGAALGASQADAEGDSAGDIVAQTLKGGAIGGAVGGVAGKLADGLSALLPENSAVEAATDTATDAADTKTQDALDDAMDTSTPATPPSQPSGSGQVTKSAASQELMQWAQDNALRAIKPTMGDLENLGPDGQQKLGKWLINKGLGGNAPAEDKLSAVNSILADTGSKLGDIANSLDDRDATGINPNDILNSVQDNYADLYGDTPAYQWVTKTLSNQAGDGTNLNFNGSLNLKKIIQAKAFSMSGDPSSIGQANFLRKVAGEVNDAYKSAAQDALDDDDYQQFLALNHDYNQGKIAQDILQGAQAKEFGGGKNWKWKSSDLGAMAGAMGAVAAGHPIIGGALAIGKYAMNQMTGPGVEGALQEAASSALDQTGNLVAKTIQAAPQMMGKYAAPLQSALSRGSVSFAVAHSLLSQTDPAYREKVRALADNTDNTGSTDE